METTENRQIKKNNLFLAYAGVFAVVGLVSLVLTQNILAPGTPQGAQVVAAVDKNPYENISIEGKAAFVFDALTGDILYTKNEDAQLPLASLTKMMVALIVTETLDPDSVVTITYGSLSTEGDSGFAPGDSWYMRDLLDFSLMTSSNDGVTALSEAVEASVGIPMAQLMTNRARALGLKQTYFLNPTGLDEHEQFFSGAYGSAKDMGILLAHIANYNPGALEATTASDRVFVNLDSKEFVAHNTNNVTGNIPGLSASKTGFTDLAGGNLAVAFEPEPGHTIIVVVLGSTIDGRFSDVERLVRAALE